MFFSQSLESNMLESSSTTRSDLVAEVGEKLVYPWGRALKHLRNQTMPRSRRGAYLVLGYNCCIFFTDVGNGGTVYLAPGSRHAPHFSCTTSDQDCAAQRVQTDQNYQQRRLNIFYASIVMKLAEVGRYLEALDQCYRGTLRTLFMMSLYHIRPVPRSCGFDDQPDSRKNTTF